LPTGNESLAQIWDVDMAKTSTKGCPTAPNWTINAPTRVTRLNDTGFESVDISSDGKVVALGMEAVSSVGLVRPTHFRR
jgi:hypothetical protein